MGDNYISKVWLSGIPQIHSFVVKDLHLKEAEKEFAIASLGNNLVVLDIELTNELINEGKLRELIRELQVARKEADFNIDDRIVLNLTTEDGEINNLIKSNLSTINAEVLSKSNDEIVDGFKKEITIDNKVVVVKMKKFN